MLFRLRTPPPYSDFLEYGINYTGDFSGVTVAAGATGTSANGKGFTSAANPELKNFSTWQVGAQVGYAGFKVGGGYFDADDFNVRAGTSSGDQHAWNAGASYTSGPVAVALNYADAEGYKSARTAPMPKSTRSMASAVPTPSPPACCFSRT